MTKRAHEEDVDVLPSSKKLRPISTDRLSILSDELLLRTLSYLSVSDLVLCERLSRRLQALAGDSQLWKGLFYNRFVRPRASRIPGLRDQEAWARSLFYSTRISKWLNDSHLLTRENTTNWKRQYKLRHNWSKGSARLSETTVAEQPSTPPLLLRLQDDVVVVADATTGLRAWALKGDDRLIASVEIAPGIPTALAIDDTETLVHGTNIVVGFDDGGFAIFILKREEREFALQYTHAPSTNGAIHALAYASPYLLTMTGEPLLSLFQVPCCSKDSAANAVEPPRLVSSLRSHTAYPPISLAIRTSSANIIASIAYAVPTWTMGWSVGLQEVRLTSEGALAESRMASALSDPLANSSLYQPGANVLSLSQNHGRGRIPSVTKPTSLSYNHPYLLSAHADNTLTLYLVTSNAEELSIGAGNRLWGHTSSVTSAQIGDRGKAVSVSALGDELRVWELEGGFLCNGSKRRAAAGQSSVQVRPEKRSVPRASEIEEEAVAGLPDATHSTPASAQTLGERNTTKGWIAFDEEKVVLLREKLQGAQALVVYDFS